MAVFASRDLLRRIVRKTVDVEVPVWVGNNGSAPVETPVTFRLRELSGTDRDRFEIAAFKDQPDGKRTIESLYLRARLVALCAISEDGQRLYADEEVTSLSDGMPASSLGKLFEAAQKLNGLDAGAVEAAAKNSGSGQAAASTSA